MPSNESRTQVISRPDAGGSSARQRPDLAEWMALPVAEIAAHVAPHRRALLIGQDGTRRYALLRDPASREDWARYTQLAADATLELIERCFAHGVQTVVIGMLWPPNFERGGAYVRAFLGPHGLPRLFDAQHAAVYAKWNAKARISGTWEQADPDVVKEMRVIADRLVETTPSGERLILWEADAGNIVEAMLHAAARVGPSEEAVRRALYPEGPERIHLAVKPGRIRSLNRIVSPLLLERTDIYVTTNLTLDLTDAQLRAILYDHLYLREEAPEDNMSYSDEYLAAYRSWYAERPPRVAGLGELDPGGNWVVRGAEDPGGRPEMASRKNGRKKGASVPLRKSPDRIQISNLLLRAVIGISPEERKDRQDVVLNLTVYCDTAAAGRSDRIEDAVNYRSICKRVIQEVEASDCQLLETLVNRLAETIVREFEADAVRVRAEKPGALRFARSVAVEVCRTREDLGR